MPTLTGTGTIDAMSSEAELSLRSLRPFIMPLSALGSSAGQSLHHKSFVLSRASMTCALRHILRLGYVPLVATLSTPSIVRCGVVLREVVAPVGLRSCRSAALGQGSPASPALLPMFHHRPSARSQGLSLLLFDILMLILSALSERPLAHPQAHRTHAWSLVAHTSTLLSPHISPLSHLTPHILHPTSYILHLTR